MNNTEEKFELKNALKIGFVCILTYMSSYYMRNILSVSTPQMLENADFTKEFIASMSSVYMIVYAAGQLINGVIGDIIKPRYMVFFGLILAAIAQLAFPFAGEVFLQIGCFALLGFGFSMLRGPIVKIISENMKPTHAQMGCVFLSVSCHAGPLIASLFALFFKWKTIFVISGFVSVILAFFSLTSFAMLEKNGLIVPVKSVKEKSKTGFLQIFKLENFVVFLLIGMVIEIAGTAVSFWLPTYISEYLGFASNVSGVVYSVISLIKSVGPFLSLIFYRMFKKNDMIAMRVMFAVAAVLFACMSVISNVWLNLVFLLFAMLANCCASGVMWSIYIPSLAKSGKVSSVNGILDCSGYVAAAAATTGFAYIMNLFGWRGTILMWAIVTFIGAVITFFGKKK